MNRKFFTLLISLVLATFTVFAQRFDSSIKLKVGANDDLYQIVSGSLGRLVSLDSSRLSYPLGLLTSAEASGNDLLRTLWCIHIDDSNQGQAPKFDFTNKRFGRVLDIPIDGAMAAVSGGVASSQLMVGGNISGWFFSCTYADGVEQYRPIYSYYKPDSVIALKARGGMIVGVKMGANELERKTADPAYQFFLRRPKRMGLDAAALNTLLGTRAGKSFKLSFAPKADPNVFARELVAKDTTLADGPWVTVRSKSTGNYLRVDSAYHNTTGALFIKLTDTTTVSTYNSEPAGHTGQYAFKFEYAPASDSVFITVNKARLFREEGKTWAQSYEYQNRDSLYVYVQDLATSNVLTVGTDPTSTHIQLGLGACDNLPVVTDTTIASDLYVIKNLKGQYLAVSVYNDTTTNWVTLKKNVDPWSMPSFQWVVEPQVNSKTSPIRVTNREYSKRYYPNIQLNKVLPVSMGDMNMINEEVLPESFIAATAAVKADSLLGYKYIDPEEQQETHYKFRYVDGLTNRLYMGINREVNDSMLYIGRQPCEFLLKPVAGGWESYGYVSPKVNGLKPLYRQHYMLTMVNSKSILGTKADKVVLNKDTCLAVSQSNPATFLLKAVNHETVANRCSPFYTFIGVGPNESMPVMLKIDNNRIIKCDSLSLPSVFFVENFFDPTPPPLTPFYHPVNLSKVEGAITSPVGGQYYIEDGYNFRFYLTLDKEYDQSKPIVTTNRLDTIRPAASNGAYIIKYICEPLDIFIEGVKRNTSVGNTEIPDNDIQVKAENGMLSIFSSKSLRACIYTFRGDVYKDLGKVNGNAKVLLPKGSYIVRIGEKSWKIVL